MFNKILKLLLGISIGTALVAIPFFVFAQTYGSYGSFSFWFVDEDDETVITQDSEFNVKVTGDLTATGSASSTGGLFTQGSGHYGGSLSVDGDVNIGGTLSANNIGSSGNRIREGFFDVLRTQWLEVSENIIDNSLKIGSSTNAFNTLLVMENTAGAGTLTWNVDGSGFDFDNSVNINGNATTTGNFTANSTLFVVDGQVSIGTDTPLAQLHVFEGDSGVSPAPGLANFFLENNGDTGQTLGISLTGVGSYNIGDSADFGRTRILGTGRDHATLPSTMLIVQNGAIAMVIDGSQQVGIGTTTPQYLLTVEGTTGNLLQVATTTNQNIFVINSDGNVGIGNNAPEVSLEVGDATGEEIIRVSSGGNSDAILSANSFYSTGNPLTQYIVAGGNNWVTGVDNADSDKYKISFHITDLGTNNFLSIQTDGKVGIGTASPATLLEVNGHASTTQLTVGNDGATINGDLLSAGGIKHLGDLDTSLSFFTNRIILNAGGTIDNHIDIQKSQIVIGNSNADINFRILDTSSNDIFFADAGLNRVGIGTASPLTKLHVEDSSGLSMRLSSSINDFVNFAVNTAGRLTVTTLDTGGSDAYIFLNPQEDVRINTDKTTFTLKGNARNPKLIVESDDEAIGDAIILIETDTAARSVGWSAAKARAGGAAVQDGDALGVYRFMAHDGTDYNQVVEITAIVNGAVSANTIPTDLLFKTTITNSPETRMTILSGGNIGIGTTAPTSTLQVDGGDVHFTGGGSADAPGLFWDNSASRLGIGTTSPSVKLEVHEAIISGGTSAFIIRDIDTSVNVLDVGGSGQFNIRGLDVFIEAGFSIVNGNVAIGSVSAATEALEVTGVTQLGDGGANDYVEFGNPDTADVSFIEGGNIKMFWDSSEGSLGIGTTTPLYKLVVDTGILMVDAGDGTCNSLSLNPGTICTNELIVIDQDAVSGYTTSTEPVINGDFITLEWDVVTQSGIHTTLNVDEATTTIGHDGDYMLSAGFWNDKTGGTAALFEASFFVNNVQLAGCNTERIVNANNETGYFAIMCEIPLLENDLITVKIGCNTEFCQLERNGTLVSEPTTATISIIKIK